MRRVQKIATATATGRTKKAALNGIGRGSTIFVSGIFVATYDIDVSHDGTTWFAAMGPDGTAIAQGQMAVGVFVLGGEFPFISIDVTTFVSGTIEVDHADNGPN